MIKKNRLDDEGFLWNVVHNDTKSSVGQSLLLYYEEISQEEGAGGWWLVAGGWGWGWGRAWPPRLGNWSSQAGTRFSVLGNCLGKRNKCF